MGIVNREGNNSWVAQDEVAKAVKSVAKNPEEMTESQKMFSCNTQNT